MGLEDRMDDLEQIKEVVKNNQLFRTNSTFHFTYGDMSQYRYGYVNAPCYAYVEKPEPINSLVVFHKHVKDNIPYINFLLNSKYLGKCFITKDAEEGFKEGFVIDCNQPANTIRAAIISLRSPFEHPRVAFWFNRLKTMGYSNEESFYFGICLRCSKVNKKISNSWKDHGVDISGHSFLGDIISGTLYNENLPMNVSGRRSHSLQAKALGENVKDLFPNLADNIRDRDWNGSYVVVDHPQNINFVGKILNKHPDRVETLNYGYPVVSIPGSDKNIQTLIEMYKKEYGIDT